MDLNNLNFKENKQRILKNLQYGIDNLNMDKLARIRNNKKGLKWILWQLWVLPENMEILIYY